VSVLFVTPLAGWCQTCYHFWPSRMKIPVDPAELGLFLSVFFSPRLCYLLPLPFPPCLISFPLLALPSVFFPLAEPNILNVPPGLTQGRVFDPSPPPSFWSPFPENSRFGSHGPETGRGPCSASPCLSPLWRRSELAEGSGLGLVFHKSSLPLLVCLKTRLGSSSPRLLKADF